MEILHGQAPERVWHYFEEISAIPRGSGNEAGIADYLEAFARAHGLESYRDALHNVMIYKPASAGCEAAAPLMLQGHTDIVCEKNAEVAHDFLRDPIRLQVVDGWVTADGTTLGADNGIAVAYMLAALDDDTLLHPALECLFTAQEEVGLIGAAAFDGSKIHARRMVNMDCGGEGTVTVSCAGGMRIDLSREVTRVPFAGQALRIFVTGLAGGHSGGQIDKYLGNANRILGRVLAAIPEANLVRVSGGSKDNAIPREAEAVVAVACRDCAAKAVHAMEETIRAELGAGDRTVVLSFGGSLGARRVNEVVADLCAWEQQEHKPVLHLHATGQYGVQLFKDLEKEKNFAEGSSLVVKEYINNMPELLAAADLVISRAGALTLAELEAVGRAAVLIPSPNVAENHQYFNAMELQKAGAAVVIEEKDLTGEKLVGTVADLLAQPGKLAEMGKNARSLSVDDSLDRIAAALMKLVQKH